MAAPEPITGRGGLSQLIDTTRRNRARDAGLTVEEARQRVDAAEAINKLCEGIALNQKETKRAVEQSAGKKFIIMHAGNETECIACEYAHPPAHLFIYHPPVTAGTIMMITVNNAGNIITQLARVRACVCAYACVCTCVCA